MFPFLPICGLRTPVPRGFMPWISRDGEAVEPVQCMADPNCSIGPMFVIQWSDFERLIYAHPVTWGATGASNLANAYRPEGV